MTTDFSSYKRSLCRWLEVQGWIATSDPGNWTEPQGIDAKARRAGWLRESLLWAITEFEAGRFKYALRGLCQVHNYAGDFNHDVTSKDATTCLQAEIEARLEGATP